jgi:hypothetical protein
MAGLRVRTPNRRRGVVAYVIMNRTSANSTALCENTPSCLGNLSGLKIPRSRRGDVRHVAGLYRIPALRLASRLHKSGMHSTNTTALNFLAYYQEDDGKD